VEKKVKKPRGGTRSPEERAEALELKQKFHQGYIDKLEVQKQKILHPVPRVRLKNTMSEEDNRHYERSRKRSYLHIEDKAQVVNGYMGIAISYGGKTEVIPAVKKESTDLEYQLTTAIKKVITDNLGTVAFLTSHGSVGLEGISDAKTGIAELYQVEELDLKEKKEVPANINTLIMVGPKEKFEDAELKALNEFLVSGGAMVVLLDGVKIEQGLTAAKNETGLEKLFEKYGIKFNLDLVGDERNGIASFSQGFFTFQTNYPFWPKITSESFDKNNSAVSGLENVIFPWASSIEPVEGKIDPAFVSRLAQTTANAWRLVDTFNITPNNIAPTGELKMHTLALAVNGNLKSAYPAKDKKEGEEFAGRLAIVGDSDFLADNFVRGIPDNLVFFQNLVDSFSLGSDLISIRSKSISIGQIKELDDQQRLAIRYANVFGITVLVVAYGILRYYLRRRSRFVDEL
jgi:ABC-type uncharacterized transport system involved in gliding motility auxiliary subunit